MIIFGREPDGAIMNAYDRPTDSPPITRRTVIMNTGLAAAAIAGLSSCTNYGTAPVSEPSAGGTSGAQVGRAVQAELERQGNRHTRWKRQDLSRRPDGDHSAKRGSSKRSVQYVRIKAVR